MDLEARGISYAAHSAVGEKLLSLPRPERAVATRQQRWAHMGCQRLLRRAEGTEGKVDEGWRGCSTVSVPPRFAGRAEGHAQGSTRQRPHHPARGPEELPAMAGVWKGAHLSTMD